MSQSPVNYKHHRFRPSVIGHAVWLYVRLPLSLRLVEEMLLERGIGVSYETALLGEEVRFGLCRPLATESAEPE